jgi:hypothetical protein
MAREAAHQPTPKHSGAGSKLPGKHQAPPGKTKAEDCPDDGSDPCGTTGKGDKGL